MNKRGFVFLEFLIGGVLLGIIEDFIIIGILTDESITLSILLIIFLVTLPFAFLGEYVIDKIDFIKLFKLNKKYKKIEVFLEFLLFGILLGVVEDLIAFYFSIGDPLTLNVIFTSFIVAIPFAFISEFLIDKLDLQKTFEKKKIIWKK